MLQLTSFEESISPPFDFESTARAHGWIALRPFAWHASTAELSRICRLSDGQVVRVKMQAGPETTTVQIAVEHARPLTPAAKAEIRQMARRMLRLDEDFSEFYELARQFDGWQLNLTPGGGRLLRCPTLFEDIVYTLCTTNISWSGTIRMVDRLVAKLGEPLPGQAQASAFPTPEAIAAAGPEFLKRETGLGYRSDYVWELAVKVAEGQLDLAGLADPSLSTVELQRELRKIKGVGEYAAATMLMLLGRYEHLAIDSELRAFATKKYFNGEAPADAQLRAIYAPWGKWQYLAYWFDMPASTE